MTDKSMHTPGPWETDKVAVRSQGQKGRHIALCEITFRGRPYDETYDEAIANARLIAASPELLKLAEMALEWIDAIPKSVAEKLPAMPGFDRDWANIVVAKAKGGAA